MRAKSGWGKWEKEVRTGDSREVKTKKHDHLSLPYTSTLKDSARNNRDPSCHQQSTPTRALRWPRLSTPRTQRSADEQSQRLKTVLGPGRHPFDQQTCRSNSGHADPAQRRPILPLAAGRTNTQSTLQQRTISLRAGFPMHLRLDTRHAQSSISCTFTPATSDEL